jgi:hypothetical protein
VHRYEHGYGKRSHDIVSLSHTLLSSSTFPNHNSSMATLSTLALYTKYENRTARQLLRPAKPSNPSFPLFPRPTSGPQATRRIACVHLPSLQAHYLFPPPFSLKPNLLFSPQSVLLLLLLLLFLHILLLELPNPPAHRRPTFTSPSRGFQGKGREKAAERLARSGIGDFITSDHCCGISRYSFEGWAWLAEGARERAISIVANEQQGREERPGGWKVLGEERCDRF